MADYKRMVSYMYQYEHGVKKKNVGYVRIEARNGLCKITVHMQLLGHLDSIFPTYLLQRHRGDLELIYLGDTVLKNQVMDSKLSAEEANIMGSGYSLSDIGGLLIFLNNNIFFATEWDDKPIVAGEVLEALKPKEKKRDAVIADDKSINNKIVVGNESETDKAETDEVETGKTDTDKVEIDQAQIAKEKAAEGDNNKIEAADLIGLDPLEGFTLEEELKLPKYKLPRGWKTVERIPFQKSYNKDTVEAAYIGYVAEDEENSENCYTEPESYDNCNIDNDDNTYGNQPISEYDGNTYGNQSECNNDDNIYGRQPISDYDKCEESPENSTARHFFTHYPRIYPFEDNEIELCVKIEPKDIGLLPNALWAFSNNSFLMHGFYCYHHLIFAKMKDGCSFRYILGIPGIYHNREQFMARMFGFEEFKSIRRRELRQGDFGYWLLQINF